MVDGAAEFEATRMTVGLSAAASLSDVFVDQDDDTRRVPTSTMSIMSQIVGHIVDIDEDFDFETGVPEIRELLGRLNDEQLKHLTLVLCMQHRLDIDPKDDPRLKFYRLLKYRPFYLAARSSACARFVGSLNTVYTAGHGDTTPLHRCAFWLGLIAFHMNTPLLSEELDWRKLLNESVTHGNLNDMIAVVLTFLSASVGRTEEVVFTTSSAWVRVIYEKLYEFAIDETSDITITTRKNVIEAVHKLEDWDPTATALEAAPKKFSAKFFRYNGPSNNMKIALTRLEQTCRDLYPQLADPEFPDGVTHMTIQRIKAKTMAMVREAVVKRSVQVLTTTLKGQASYIRRTITDDVSFAELEHTAQELYNIAVATLGDSFFSQEYMANMISDLTAVLEASGVGQKVQPANIQMVLLKFFDDCKETVGQGGHQMCCEIIQMEIFWYLQNILCQGQCVDYKYPFIQFPPHHEAVNEFPAPDYASLPEVLKTEAESAAASIWSLQLFTMFDGEAKYPPNGAIILPDQNFQELLKKFDWDMRVLITTLPEGGANEPMYKAMLRLILRIKSYIYALNVTAWQAAIGQGCAEFVENYSNISEEAADHICTIGLQQCYRRAVHYLIAIYGRKFSSSEIGATLASNIFVVIQKASISVPALKDLLQHHCVSASAFDESFHRLIASTVVLGPKMDEFMQRYREFGLSMLLPKTGETLIKHELVANLQRFPLTVFSTFRQASTDVLFGWMHLAAGYEVRGSHPGLLVTQLLFENNSFTFTDGAFFLTQLVFDQALSVYPVIHPFDPYYDTENVTRLWIADGWALLVVYLVDMHSGCVASRARFFKRLLSVLIDAMFKQPDNIQFFRLYVRAIITVTRGLSNKNENREDRVAFLHILLNVLFEVQPTIMPTFSCHWLCIMGDSFMMETMWSAREDVALRFLKCFMSGFNLIQDVYEGGLDDKCVVHFIDGMRKTLIVLCTANPKIFADYYYLFVPHLPVYFQYVRHVFLLASDAEKFNFGFKIMTVRNFVKLPESQQHPTCHNQPMPGLPSKFRDLLKMIPACTRFDDIASLIVGFFRTQPTPYGMYNFPRIYSFVIACASAAVEHVVERDGGLTVDGVLHSAYSNLFVALLEQLCDRGAVFLAHAMVDQLRFPNSHTTFFACLIPLLFTSSPKFREIITGVLFRHMSIIGPTRIGLLVCSAEMANSCGLLSTECMSEPLLAEFAARLREFAAQARINSAAAEAEEAAAANNDPEMQAEA
uniref:Not1 domain-containing protein n=1 Tax=Panagrellus redivivus TaxID=6233 RepID=A0A7E4VS10_PANRE